MSFRPPKGIRPPQLEGKRTGRPQGSKNHAKFWAPVLWGFAHRYHEQASPPSIEASLWWGIASRYPDEVEEWLEVCGQVVNGVSVASIKTVFLPPQQAGQGTG